MLKQQRLKLTSFEIINFILSLCTIILSFTFPKIDKIYGGSSLLLASILSMLFIRILPLEFKNLEINVLQAHIFISIFLGTTLNFYTIIPNFDFYLHLIFGFVCCILSMPFIRYFIKKSNLKINRINISFVLFIVFCFSMTCGALWEIYEFTVDTLFNLTTQNNSLLDTMSDIIANTLGAISFIILYAITQKKQDN